MSIFKLPDLGEGLTDAEIREWYVKVGDVVELDQPLVAMETAKALVDIPSPQAGEITKLHGKAGDIIDTGAPLIEFAGNAGASEKKDSGTVVGAIEESDAVLNEPATGVTVATQTSKAANVKAIPAARILANKLGVNLASITPTGTNGRITVDDVKQAAEAGQATTAAPTAVKPTLTGAKELHGPRRAMAQFMAQAHTQVVPTSLFDDADIHAWSKETDFTLRLIRAMVAAIKAEPTLNSHYDGSTLSQSIRKDINLGIAVDTPKGLYVPVIKDVANQGNKSLRKHLNQFKTMAKEQNFPPDILHDATMIMSNVGTIAGRYATPMIMPPMVGIIAIGVARDGVIAVDGQPVVHRILPVSITFDHRVVTGGEAARFLAAFIGDLEVPS